MLARRERASPNNHRLWRPSRKAETLTRWRRQSRCRLSLSPTARPCRSLRRSMSSQWTNRRRYTASDQAVPQLRLPRASEGWPPPAVAPRSRGPNARPEAARRRQRRSPGLVGVQAPAALSSCRPSTSTHPRNQRGESTNSSRSSKPARVLGRVSRRPGPTKPWPNRS